MDISKNILFWERPQIGRTKAPMMLMAPWFAAVNFLVTGRRWCLVRPTLCRNCTLARHDWHLVSTTAEETAGVGLDSEVGNPRDLASSHQARFEQ